MDKNRSKLTVICTSWRPLRRHSLMGFARIRIAEFAFTINDIAIHESHGKLWAAPPSKPWIKDNKLVLGDDGRPQYSPIFEFDRRDVSDAFSRAVVDAVVRFDPRALAVEEAVT
jgi:hypothetical protein